MKQRYLSIALLMLCTGVHADNPITMSKAVIGYTASNEKQRHILCSLTKLKDILSEDAYLTCEKVMRGMSLSDDDYAQLENAQTLLAERNDAPSDVMAMLTKCMQMKRSQGEADRAPHTVPSNSQIAESQPDELGEVTVIPLHIFAEKDIIATQGIRGRFGVIDNDINSQALNFAAGGPNATAGGTANAQNSNGFNFASRDGTATSNDSNGFNFASRATATSNNSNGINFASFFATATSNNSDGFNFASVATATSNDSNGINFASFLGTATSNNSDGFNFASRATATSNNSDGFNFASRATATSSGFSHGFNFASRNAEIHTATASAINMVARGGTLGEPTTPYELEGINLNAGTEADGFIRQYTNDLQRWQLTNEGGINAGLGGKEAGTAGALDSAVGFNILIDGIDNAGTAQARTLTSDAASFNLAMGQDSVATSTNNSKSFNVASRAATATSSNSNGINFASFLGTATSNDSDGINFASFGTATSNNSDGFNFASFFGTATSSGFSHGFNFASRNAEIHTATASAINMVARGGTLGDITTPYGLEGINLNAGTEADGFIRQYTNDLQRWQLTNEGGINAGLGGKEAGTAGALDSAVGFNILIDGIDNAGTAQARTLTSDAASFNLAMGQDSVATSTNNSKSFNVASRAATATSSNSNGINFASFLGTATSNDSDGINFASFGTATSNNSDGFNFASFFGTATSSGFSHGFNFASRNAEIHTATASAINMVARGGTLGEPTTPYELEGINLNAGTEADGFIRQYTNDLQRWQLTNEGGINAGLGGIEAGATGVLDSDVGFNVLIQGSGNAEARNVQNGTNGSFNVALGQNARARSQTSVGGERDFSFNFAIEGGFADSIDSSSFNFATNSGTARSTGGSGFSFATGGTSITNGSSFNFVLPGASIQTNSDNQAFNFVAPGLNANTEAGITPFGSTRQGFNVFVDSDGSSGTVSNIRFIGLSNIITGTALEIDATGAVVANASSQRFKNNIKDLDAETVEKASNLRPVTFTYKADEGNKRQIGLIAEEVYELVPELVNLDEEGNPFSVRYAQLAPLLLALAQKQQQTIEDLQARVSKLESAA